MDQEVIKTLELINKGLEGLPDFTSQAWETMVQGYRMEAIFQSSLCLLSVIILLIIFSKIKKLVSFGKKNWDFHDVAHVLDVVPSYMTAIICAVIVFLIVLILDTVDIIPHMFAPEYFLIKDLIGL